MPIQMAITGPTAAGKYEIRRAERLPGFDPAPVCECETYEAAQQMIRNVDGWEHAPTPASAAKRRLTAKIAALTDDQLKESARLLARAGKDEEKLVRALILDEFERRHGAEAADKLLTETETEIGP